MGEQSAKSLRGGKMNDVIFQGSENKNPLNLAEVNLTFSNSDKVLDIAYDKVVIGRRIYRDGENEYKINGKKVRLKDVKELFLDTGIGKEGYTLIGQGRIDEIISSSNLERRAIFEEASGIAKHKYRRDEASKKLIKVSEDLELIEYERSYKEKDLEKLKNEACNYNKWAKLSEELNFKSYNYFSNKSIKLKDQISKTKNLSEDFDKKILAKTALIEKTREKLAPFTQTNEESQKTIEELENSIKIKEREIEKNKNKMDLNKQKLSYTQKDFDRLSQSNDQNTNKLSNLEAQLEKEKENLSEKNSYRDILSKNIKENENQLLKINEDIESLKVKSKDINDKFDLINPKIYDYEINIKTKEILDEKFSKEKEENLLKLEKLNEILDEINGQINDLSKKKIELVNINESLSQRIFNLDQDLKTNDEDVKDCENALSKNEINLKVAINDYKFNKNLIDKNEGYFYSVSEFLNKTKANNLNNLYEDTLANLITIKSGYEDILDKLLGNALQNVVSRTKDETRDLIKFINQNHLGQVTFLPIDSIFASKKEKPNHKEVIAMAYELVDYENRLSNIINHFLGSTVVVKNIDDATSLSKKIKGYRIITLDLDIINAWGSMASGSNKNKKNQNSIINRNKKLEDSKDEVVSLKRERIAIESKLKIIKDKKLENEDSLEKIKSKFYKNKEEISKFTNNILNLNYKVENILGQKNELTDKLEEKSSQIDQREINLLYQKKDEYNKNLLEINNSLENLSQEKTDLDKNLIKEKNDLEITNRDINMLNNTIGKIKDDINNINNSQKIEEKIREENKKTIDDIHFENKKIASNLEFAKIDLEKLNANLSEKKLIYERAKKNNKDLLDELKINEDELSQINLDKVKNGYKLETYSKDYENLLDEIEPFLTNNIDKLEEKYKDEKVIKVNKTDLINLQKEINKIGYFTADSLENYRSSKEDFDFVDRQVSDLKKSKANIEEMIKSLESEMKDEFVKNFKIINENFQKIFKILFMGGNASLKLDSDDALNAGIDIIARPPSKSLKTISLLSGGEKSLTAVALLFAIFETNPAPFAILDEIDAALDETNIKRYIEYLKMLAKNSQFIMITHRQTTMQLAEKIHGITIDDQGVSKIYSLDFDKNWNIFDKK